MKKKSQLVSKANSFIESKYDVNLVAQRVIILAIIVARDSGDMMKVGGVHRILATDYSEHFECDKTTSYRSLKSACDSLYESEFIWLSKDDNGKNQVNRSRLVQRASYSEGGGYVEVMFGNDVIPLITRLSEQYTEYELKQIKDLNSTYSLRIFEMLMQWSVKRETPYINIIELRERLGIKESQYKTMGNFKKRVLDFAIKEISDNTNITVSYEQKKEGRKIIAFKFKFKVKADKKSKTSNKSVENKNHVALTKSQISTFASKLASQHNFSNNVFTANLGEDMKAYTFRVEQALSKYENQQKWIDCLISVGFNPTYK